MGRAIALELAAAGLDLIVHTRRSTEALDALVASVARAGRRAWPVVADFADPPGQEAFIAGVLERTRDIDVLVHNAGLYAKTELTGLTREQLEAMHQVNLAAPLFITRGLLPALLRGQDPCIIHLGDSATARPYPGHAAYFTSKAGVDALTRCLALELSPRVRVNAVAPGTVAFPEEMAPAVRRSITQAIPLGRIGAVEDVARAVRFLALEAPFVTGQTLCVDGGRSVAP